MIFGVRAIGLAASAMLLLFGVGEANAGILLSDLIVELQP